VVDSGLDTRHAEFTGGGNSHTREVRNLFDAYLPSPSSGTSSGTSFSSSSSAAAAAGTDSHHPLNNNDVLGHGTHCAGVVGGANIGVSPGVNIYGVKVIGPDGEGGDHHILAGLDFIADRVKAARAAGSGGRSVVTMSLGTS